MNNTELFLKNIGLVGKISAKFPPGQSSDNADYFQIGALALWELIEKGQFDPQRGKFSSYACKAIYRAIKCSLSPYSYPIDEETMFYSVEESIEEIIPDYLSPAEHKAVLMLANGATFQDIACKLNVPAKKLLMGVVEQMEDKRK